MKRGHSKDYILTKAQVEALFRAAEDGGYSVIDKVILHLALIMGMRAAEIAHLHRTWIVEDEIQIPPYQPCDCSVCKGSKEGVWKPKFAASVRSLPMPPIVQALLTPYFKNRERLELVTRMAIWLHIKRLLRQIGVPKAFPHALRATCATNLAANGVEAAAICYFMGWSDLSYAQFYVRITRAKDEARRQIHRIYG